MTNPIPDMPAAEFAAKVEETLVWLAGVMDAHPVHPMGYTAEDTGYVIRRQQQTIADLTAREERLRSALLRARPLVQIEVARGENLAKLGWHVPAIADLAEIDAALALAQTQGEE